MSESPRDPERERAEEHGNGETAPPADGAGAAPPGYTAAPGAIHYDQESKDTISNVDLKDAVRRDQEREQFIEPQRPTAPPAAPPRPPAPQSPPGYREPQAAPPTQQAPRPNYPPVYPQPPQGQQPPPYAGPRPQQPPPPYGAPPPWQQQAGPGPYGPPPPYGPPGGYSQYPQPRRGRNRVVPVVVGVVVLIGVLLVGGIALLSSLGGGGSGTTTPSFLMGKKIGILEVEGVLGEGDAYGANTAKLVEQVKAWTDSDSIAAIVIRINSPGGAVSATQDLYHALEGFRNSGQDGKKRPIVVSMGDVAASGGYYTAMAADKIYANEGSLTGSVGVIMSFYDYQGLQDMVGVHSRNVKSGEFKDMGSGSRAMTPREEELLHTMILDVYDQFFGAVVAGRADRVRKTLDAANPQTVTDDQVRAHLAQYCDGRVFSGRQGLQYGMIDAIGTLDDAVAEAARMAGMSNPDDAPFITGPIKRQPGLFGQISNKIEAIPDKFSAGSVLMEYRFAGP